MEEHLDIWRGTYETSLVKFLSIAIGLRGQS